jgi:hypothetical protein
MAEGAPALPRDRVTASPLPLHLVNAPASLVDFAKMELRRKLIVWFKSQRVSLDADFIPTFFSTETFEVFYADVASGTIACRLAETRTNERIQKKSIANPPFHDPYERFVRRDEMEHDQVAFYENVPFNQSDSIIAKAEVDTFCMECASTSATLASYCDSHPNAVDLLY